MSSAFTKKLRAAIKTKIKEFGVDADDELPDYVMVLAANRKSRQQIRTDLQLFLGKHTENFVSWLFDAFEKIQKSEAEPSTSAPEKRAKSPEEVKTAEKEKKPSRSPSVELIPASSRLKSQVVIPENSTINSCRNKDASRSDRTRSHHSESDRNRPETSRSRNYERPRRRSRSPERRRDSDPKKQSTDRYRAEQSTKISDDESEVDKKKPSTQRPKRSYSPKIHYDDEQQAGPSSKSNEKNLIDEGQSEEEILMVDNGRPKERESRTTKFIIRVGNKQVCRTVSVDPPDSITRKSPKVELNVDSRQQRKRHVDDPSRAVKQLLGSQNVRITSSAAERIKRFDGKENVKKARIEKTIDDASQADLVIEPYSPAPLQTNDAEEEQKIDNILTSLQQEQVCFQPTAFYQPPTTHSTAMVIRAERCRFWPDCEKGEDCPYHHPNRLCAKFPNCSFGTQCLNVHPMCKFNLNCKKLDCPYTHNLKPNPSTHLHSSRPSANSYTSSDSASDMVSDVCSTVTSATQIPCKYRNRCTDKNCDKLHPPDCRFGLNCRNRSCKFTHKKPDFSRYQWTANS